MILYEITTVIIS